MLPSFAHTKTVLDITFQLLRYQSEILALLKLLVDKTKSERGYTSTGRLITRILNTTGGVYPLNTRFVNTDEWDTPGVYT